MNRSDTEKMLYFSQQQSPAGEKVSLKHQLLQVIVRVAQYRMLLTGECSLSILLELYVSNMFSFLTLWRHSFFSTPLTDYLNNLSPDSKEYEDTQGTVNML